MNPEQPSLFDAPPAPPLSRRTDPATSRMAADAVRQSGTHGQQKRDVLAALRRYPGSTSAELAEHSGLGRYVCARRLPELRKEGSVKMGFSKMCWVSKRLAHTWTATEGDRR